MGQYLFWEPNRTFRGGSNLLLPLTNLMEAIIFKVVVSLAFLLPGIGLNSSMDKVNGNLGPLREGLSLKKDRSHQGVSKKISCNFNY